jgi:hypothetical protein
MRGCFIGLVALTLIVFGGLYIFNFLPSPSLSEIYGTLLITLALVFVANDNIQFGEKK